MIKVKGSFFSYNASHCLSSEAYLIDLVHIFDT